MDFEKFSKIARWSREITITEKIDGINSSIVIGEDGSFLTMARKRLITPDNDHYGFSKWAHKNKDDLMTLGKGHHFGEWWGAGIERRYGQKSKRFSLFNVLKWGVNRPQCCDVVPILYQGNMSELKIFESLNNLRFAGSVAAPGFMTPEGIIIWHDASRVYFKKTLENDEKPKSTVKDKA